MSALRTLEITVGSGRTRPQGKRVIVEGHNLVLALRKTLAELPSWQEQWWCGSAFRADYRRESNWDRSDLVGVDLDYRDDAGSHAVVPDEFQDRLGTRRLPLPGNLAHRTPRGYRVVFVLDQPVRDLATWRHSSRGAAALISSSLVAHRLGAGPGLGRKAGLSVDQGASTDPARLWWGPKAIVNGERRDAEVLVLRAGPFSVEMLSTFSRAAARPACPARPRPPTGAASRYGVAVLRNACERVEGAVPGDRHETLKRRARLVAGYIAGGEIDEDLAFDCLLKAAVAAGLPECEARAVITWAIEHGKQEPLAAPRWGGRR